MLLEKFLRLALHGLDLHCSNFVTGVSKAEKRWLFLRFVFLATDRSHRCLPICTYQLVPPLPRPVWCFCIKAMAHVLWMRAVSELVILFVHFQVDTTKQTNHLFAVSLYRLLPRRSPLAPRTPMFKIINGWRPHLKFLIAYYFEVYFLYNGKKWLKVLLVIKLETYKLQILGNFWLLCLC